MSHPFPGTRQISEREVTALIAAIAGSVIMPDAPGFAAECAVYNLNQRQEPALVVAAASASDVRAAVVFAAQRGLPVAVKCSAHQVVQSAHGAVLITTNRMNEVEVDPLARTARVGAAHAREPGRGEPIP